jgi:uncharacterized protein YegP (UPF0339 family)
MGRFQIKQVATGYKFDLLAANGQIIATSEVYETEAACRKGVRSVCVSAQKAKLADLTGEGKLPTNPRFELFLDKAGAYRFRLRARNGQVVAVSEGYTTREACEKGMESVRKNAAQEM